MNLIAQAAEHLHGGVSVSTILALLTIAAIILTGLGGGASFIWWIATNITTMINSLQRIEKSLNGHAHECDEDREKMGGQIEVNTKDIAELKV